MGGEDQPMKIRLIALVIMFKKGRETIDFVDFNYFYGQMGAGKSTIARLIDYCLGGDLVWTPALQSEFVSASLLLKVGEVALTVNRDANVNQIRAQWMNDEESLDVLVPARASSGEVIPDTGVEILSDLVFYLLGMVPPQSSPQQDQ